MKILALETSCDETAAAVVEDGRKVLSHVLASSADLHTKTGGIIPEIAAREQIKVIIPIIQEAIGKCKLKIENLDALAVTVGPGLIGSLLVGIETAKTLAYVCNKPIIPVNHLVGHIYANWLKNEPPPFPALALVVSGGHTDLVLMENHHKIRWIGGTRDDAAGEAFDKTARLLGLPYPGGPAIAIAAADYLLRTKGTSSAYPEGPAITTAAAKFQTRHPKTELKLFPRPLVDQDNYDWSFSGLKTAVLREVKNKGELTKEDKQQLAAEIQQAIVDVLVIKTLRAIRYYQPKSLLLGGGVSANVRLREKLKLEIRNSKLEINLSIPPTKFCTDNASMIGAAAFYLGRRPISWQKITAQPELTIVGQI